MKSPEGKPSKPKPTAKGKAAKFIPLLHNLKLDMLGKLDFPTTH